MKHYQKRNTRELDRYGNRYYSRHVEAMTTEGLHEKSAIAAELAYRDYTIDQLRENIADLSYALETLLGETEDSDYLTHAQQETLAWKTIKKARGEIST